MQYANWTVLIRLTSSMMSSKLSNGTFLIISMSLWDALFFLFFFFCLRAYALISIAYAVLVVHPSQCPYSDVVVMRLQQYWGQVTQSTNKWEDVEDEPKVISRFIFSKKKASII
jgi:hypothetical protein